MTGTPSPTGAGTTLWLDPRFGASGDMMLGVLIGLGADPVVIEAELRRGFPNLAPWKLEVSETSRSSLAATRAEVSTDDHDHHRPWSTIDALLADADFAPRATTGARKTFEALGRAEAAIHGVDLDEVHFHEVGAVDAIVDITGTWLALDQLCEAHNIDRVEAGAVGIGQGTVKAAHGSLPVPAPATAALLEGALVSPVAAEGETITPTGAALLATMVDRWGPMPAGRLGTNARAAGRWDPDSHPNVLTAYLVETAPENRSADGLTNQPSLVLSTNLDDTTAEVVAFTIERCLEAGADDAWASAIVMKKGRSAVELNVLCATDRAGELRRLLMSETGTLGVRTTPVDKHMADRRFDTATVRGHQIRIKIGPFGAKPEHDDLAAAARSLNLPIRTLAAEALDARRRDTDPAQDPGQDSPR